MEHLMSTLFEHKEEMKEQLYIELMNGIMKAHVKTLKIKVRMINVVLSFNYDTESIDTHSYDTKEYRIIRCQNSSVYFEKFNAKPFKAFKLSDNIVSTDGDNIVGLDGLFETQEHDIVICGEDIDDPNEEVKVKTSWESYKIVYVTKVEELV